jgi:hypothetical protein
MGVYNAQTGKYEPLEYGVGAPAAAPSSSGFRQGAAAAAAQAAAAAAVPLTAAQRSQLEALKGEYFTDKSRDALKNAGISQAQVDAYATENEVGPDMAIKVSQMLSVIPAKLRDNVAESKKYERLAVSLAKQGKSLIEAQRAMLGQVLPDSATSQQKEALAGAMPFINQLEPDEQTGVVRAIQDGNVDMAIRSMESAYIKKKTQGNPKFTEATTLKVVREADDLEMLVKRFESKFGPIAGRWEKLKTKFANNKEAQALMTRMTQSIANMRHELNGSSATASETVAIAPLIPDLTEETENVIEKIANLRDEALNGYNSQREALGLYRLDKNALLNERTNIYTKEKPVPAEVNQVSSGNVLPNLNAKTYSVTDSDGKTESLTVEQFQDELRKALNGVTDQRQRDVIINNAKAFAKQAGMPGY